MTSANGTRAPRLGVWTDVRPEPGESDGRTRYGQLLDELALVEKLPYATFCTTEQHGVDDGYLPAQLTLIAGLASRTDRVRFMTNALLVLLHPLRQVAEQASVVQLLSEGRLELGVAAGGYAREFELFGQEMARRGARMEQALPALRSAFADGLMHDGPDDAPVPLLPRTGHPRIPVYVGGGAPSAIDRAVRLADGVIPVDFFAPDTNIAKMWSEVLDPALTRHGRSLGDFRFKICVPLWASEDPERDWHTFYRGAVEYQFGQYAKWAGDPRLVGVETNSGTPWSLNGMLIDTPENVAQRLRAIHDQAPFHEAIFWYRIPHIGHDRAMEHLELVADRVLPVLQSS